MRLSRRPSVGDVQMHLTDPDFDVGLTVGDFGKRLYAVNARFYDAAGAGHRLLDRAVRKVS